MKLWRAVHGDAKFRFRDQIGSAQVLCPLVDPPMVKMLPQMQQPLWARSSFKGVIAAGIKRSALSLKHILCYNYQRGSPRWH